MIMSFLQYMNKKGYVLKVAQLIFILLVSKNFVNVKRIPLVKIALRKIIQINYYVQLVIKKMVIIQKKKKVLKH